MNILKFSKKVVRKAAKPKKVSFGHDSARGEKARYGAF